MFFSKTTHSIVGVDNYKFSRENCGKRRCHSGTVLFYEKRMVTPPKINKALWVYATSSYLLEANKRIPWPTIDNWLRVRIFDHLASQLSVAKKKKINLEQFRVGSWLLPTV